MKSVTYVISTSDVVLTDGRGADLWLEWSLFGLARAVGFAPFCVECGGGGRLACAVPQPASRQRFLRYPIVDSLPDSTLVRMASLQLRRERGLL